MDYFGETDERLLLVDSVNAGAENGKGEETRFYFSLYMLLY